MIDQAVSPADTQAVEASLRSDLARGDAAAASALPVLRHLIVAEDNSLLSEEVLARVRGMLANVAAQLLDALIGEADRRALAPDEIAVLTTAFLHDAVLLGHVHALALEWRLTERLQDRLALDLVVSPFMQARLAAQDGAARVFVAGQARWTQAQRRMALPLWELPEPVLDSVLAILRRLVGTEPSLADRMQALEAEARERHAASPDRLVLAARLVDAVGDDMPLDVHETGVALFLSTLAQRSGQPRETAVLSTQPGQHTRFALALTAAGASTEAVTRQMLAFHGEGNPRRTVGALDRLRAAAILAGDQAR